MIRRLLFALCLAAVFSACSKETGELRAGLESGRYRTIVAFGDSIVEGYGQVEGWPEKLGRSLSGKFGEVRVVNAGVSGDTTADGVARLRESVLDHDPDIVLVAFGLNDMKNGRSVGSFAADLERIVTGVASHGAVPVLLTTTRLQKGTGMVARVDPGPYNDTIRQMSRKRGLILIDTYEEFEGYNTNRFLMDPAHPNDEGYEVLAEIIREGLVGN